MRWKHGLIVGALVACESGKITIDEPTETDAADTSTDGPTDSGDAGDSGDSGPAGDSGDSGDSGTPTPPDPPTLAEYAADGAVTFKTKGRTVDVSQPCQFLGGSDVDYTEYVPDAPVSDTVVVLSHGFARARSNMRGWAQFLASHGFEVANADLCTSLPTDIDHPRNGRALAALTKKLYPGRDVIFVGYSAGGLASVLASTETDQAVGVFGLDMVDSNGGNPIIPSNDPYFGLEAASDVGVPFWGIRGEPSTCNEEGNSQDVYDAVSSAEAYILLDAGHCDFELPRNDGLISCTLGCPEPNPSALTNKEQTDVLKAMLLSFVKIHAGIDADEAAAFWTAGAEPHDSLTRQGGPLR